MVILLWAAVRKSESVRERNKRIRPGLVFTRGKLSQWRHWEKNLLERSTGHILDVSMNANSFCVQCSVMASAALTRDRVLHYLPSQVKFYSLRFHVIDITRLFQRNKLLYYLERFPYQIRGLVNNMVAVSLLQVKKMTLGQVVPNFTGQVVSFKILRIFRWTLWVTKCSVILSKWP